MIAIVAIVVAGHLADAPTWAWLLAALLAWRIEWQLRVLREAWNDLAAKHRASAKQRASTSTTTSAPSFGKKERRG